jgi:hypothetical protein
VLWLVAGTGGAGGQNSRVRSRAGGRLPRLCRAAFVRVVEIAHGGPSPETQQDGRQLGTDPAVLLTDLAETGC